MSDALIEVGQEERLAIGHRCQGRCGAPEIGRGVVVCFMCFRAHTRDAAPQAASPLDETPPRACEPREALTPRAIHHRRRMLEWMRRA